MFKKILAFIFAFSLIFTCAGCGTSDSSTAADDPVSGRYTEENISINEKPSVAGELFTLNNKTAFIDQQSMKLYTADDSAETFNASEMPQTSELGSKVAVCSVAGSPDGAYMLSYMDFSTDENDDNIYYAYISPDGKIKKLSFDLQWTMIDTFDFSDDGKIYACSYEGKIYEINTDDQTAKQLFSTNKEPTGFDVVSGYIIASDSNNIFFYNIADNQLMETPEVLKNFYKEQKLDSNGFMASEPACDFCKGPDNSIFIITKNGLYRYVIDGNQVEQLLDGMSYHIGSPAYTIRSVIAESENSFLVSYSEGSIMRYRYDPDASNKISSSLKIYSLIQNDTLDQTISEYIIYHPDVDIKYETGMEKDSGVTYEDAVKNLNTQICSDEAPDIIMLDGMDIDNYIDKNMLIDLNKYKDRIDPDGSLLENIAEHSQNDGLYTMPCKFKLPVIVARKENIEKINSFSDFAQMIEDKHKIIKDSAVAGFVTEEEVLDTGLDMNADKILNDKGIDADALHCMLDDCCRIYKSEHAAYSEGYVADYKASKEYNSSAVDSWGYEASGISIKLLTNNEKLACGTADGFRSSLNIITSLSDTDPDIEYRYGLTDSSSEFIPVCSFGICSAGNNTDQAVDFLKTAFSSSVQNIELYDGLPVNRESLDYFYSRNKNDAGVNFGVGDPSGDDGAYVKAKYMNDTEIDLFKNAVAKLDTPVYIDTMTRDVIISTGTKCLDGSISTDDAVKEINEKLSLKMQE
ncbi:MAG: extracellular solute-binding protein [Oscillospiraceae bacterium]|nr:extracellular solute-binding protein [Oscillospiraceae bacterium]